jgi:hypothetical protein
VVGGCAATGNYSRRRRSVGRDEDSSYVLETSRTLREKEETDEREKRGRERKKFQMQVILPFQNL